MGGGERRNDQSRPIFDGRQKTRGGGPRARYRQKLWITTADISLGLIGGGGREYFRHSGSNGDGGIYRGNVTDGSRMGGYS